MLNPQQKKAVETIQGRVLILAGAGSGKTSVITHRIAHLVSNLAIPPGAILGLTFTNKAAEEMRKRVSSLVGEARGKEVLLCTFHSFCMHLLRKEIHRLGYTKHFSLYSEREVHRLAKQLARDILEHEGDLPSLQGSLEAISLAKNRGALLPQEEGKPFLKDLFSKLATAMRAYNAVDFDSLLTLTVQLFEECPAVLATYQDQFRYLMIDEYQDTSPIQYKLADLLSKKHGNLCVVGDDDQAIYSWRGADIKNILNFQAETIIKLEENFRSTPTILRGANALIGNNRERHQKELWSRKAPGDPIHVFHAPTEENEAEAITERLIRYHEQGIPWKEMAILYRSNILSRPFELALLQAPWKKEENWVRGIPYEVFGGTEFTERSEVKDLASYLNVITNPLDQESLLRIINVPRRGISDETLDTLTQMNRSQGIPLWQLLTTLNSGISERALRSVRGFVELIETSREEFEKPGKGARLKAFLERINYEKAIAEEVKSDKMRAFKLENVAAFISTLTEWEKEHPHETLADFTASLELHNSFASRGKKGSEDKVSLMTFHSAKGLEFTACFLVCLEDHILPHEKSLTTGSLEEERRLFYVAMTRAKKHLTLSMSRARKRYGKEASSNPSRFLFELPKDLMQVGNWKL